MAIKGAFQAGLIQGFATSFAEGIKERQKRFDELVDSQMDTVRRNAPKMAQSMAEAKNADLIRQEMKAEFGVTDDGADVFFTEYGNIQTNGALFTPTFELTAGVVRLNITVGATVGNTQTVNLTIVSHITKK